MIVLWRVTTFCNLSCGFCAYDRRVSMQRTHVQADEVERMCALFGAHRAETGEDVLVSWLGGEPLLWPGVLAVSRRLREHYDVRTSVTTNGTTLHRPAVADAVAESFDEVTVSVDALADTHTRLRGWPGGWERLAEGIKRLASARTSRGAPRLRANVVLMRDTLPEFEALCGQLAEWGVQEITFNQLGGNDRPEFHRTQRLSAGDVASLRSTIPGLVTRMALRGVRLMAHPDYLDRIEASVSGRAIPVDDCDERRPTVFIDEQGRIAPCSFTTDAYGIPIGTIRTPADAAALRARFAAHRRAERAPVCRDCPSTQVFAKFGT